MPACNIDSRGKAFRLISGALAVLAGCVLGMLKVFAVVDSNWWWAGAGILVAGGAFAVYEGWAGWCAVRAMGFKTPV